MKHTYTSKIMIIMAIAIVFGIGSYAYADWGSEYGRHGRGYGHHGLYHHEMDYDRYSDGRGYGYRGNLTEDEMRNLDQEREAFLEATEGMRREINEKELALRSEIAKESPDAKKAADLQKEISEIESQINQKRVEHIIKMRKISPNAGKGFMGRGGMGYGSNYASGCR